MELGMLPTDLNNFLTELLDVFILIFSIWGMSLCLVKISMDSAFKPAVQEFLSPSISLCIFCGDLFSVLYIFLWVFILSSQF